MEEIKRFFDVSYDTNNKYFTLTVSAKRWKSNYKEKHGKFRAFHILFNINNSASCSHLGFHTKLGVEDLFTQADRLGRYLNEIIVGDILDRFLQGEDLGRREQQLFVRTRRTPSFA